MDTTSIGRRVVARSLACLLLLATAPAAWSYYEDISAPSGNHSTFHYELTRTLARAAGFSFDEAEIIAVTAEAVDVGTFQGEFSTSPSVQIQGTGRVGSVHQYYHFPRRGPTNATAAFTYPGGRNTCDYFTATADPCAPDPEVDSLELWSVFASGVPPGGTPEVANNGSALAPVSAPSLASLAIFLHSLADSYSHEKCMEVTGTRDHAMSPPICRVHEWHIDDEYGPNPQQDIGVPYTEEAARATWLALQWFRQQNGITAAVRWSDQQANDFAVEWATLDAPQDRRDLAVSILYGLTLPPDLNCDDAITVTDLTAFVVLAASGQSSRCGADPTGDHVLDSADLDAIFKALFES